MSGLVLSLFPGIDLLGRAFEEEGFVVVRGPDPIFGGDIHGFTPPPGRFDGVIGGPPCKGESTLAHLNGNPGVSLRSEFIRVRDAARPKWWVMEAVKHHHQIDPFAMLLTPRWLGCTQSRKRWFHSNILLRRHVKIEVFEPMEFKHAVLAGHGGRHGTVVRGMATYTTEEMLHLQGVGKMDKPPFWTVAGFREAIGNGVPLPMGRAVARAVKEALRNA